MKKTLTLFFITISFFGYAQFEKIGYSKTQLLNSINEQPCRYTNNAIWYCGEYSSSTGYILKNDYVTSFMHIWEFKSKSDADQNVKDLTNMLSNQYGRAQMKEDLAFWFYGGFLITARYMNSDGKHYSCWRASRSNVQ